MAGNAQGCVAGRVADGGTPEAMSYLATTYFQQGTALLCRGQYREAENYLRQVLAIWPEHSGALNNLGTAIWQQGRAIEAETYYRRALEVAPDDFGTLANLGNSLWEQARPAEAVDLYRRALELELNSAETQMNLGVALSDLGEFDEAIEWLQSSLRLNPHSPEALDNIGMTLARQGKWDEAMTWYERALAVRPDFPEAHRNRSYVWLTHGDYERGWPEHEWRLGCRNHRILPVPRPQWRGEDLRGRTILLHAEQGYGDVLQFIRFACAVKRRGPRRIIVACPDTLVRLVAQCPGVDAVQDWYAPIPDCDVHATLMSLPAILGTTLKSLPGDYPYLSPDQATVDRWQPIVDRGFESTFAESPAPESAGGRIFRIGVAWQGNPRNRIDRWRSFPLGLLAPIADLPGVRLISLQKGRGTEQVAGAGRRFPVAVLPEAGAGEEDRRDFLDTAAIMSLVDLVIAPESAVAHLAGSLGVRAWVPLPVVTDWRWLLDRDDSPWYPSMTLFRQDPSGEWEPVFRRMADRLRTELSS
ncbi:MAG: tetratricopeptide repeat protein [Isosphaeraceae bacterium]